MKILVGMPAKDSWGGPISSEPPFVEALRSLGEDVTEEIYVYGDKEKPTPFFSRISRVLKTAFRFRRILKSESFDIIHLNTAFDLKTILRDSATLFLLPKTKAKLFLKLHGSEADKFEKTNAVLRSLIKYLKNRVDGFGIHSSDEMENFLRLGFPREKLFFVKNAVSIYPDGTTKFGRQRKAADEEFRLLYISRFTPTKGLIETIRACAILKREGYRFVLRCIGDGEMGAQAEQEVSDLQLGECVKFTGYVDESEVAANFLWGDIFVFPTSHAEGFPNVLFKAVVVGMPIVTTRIRAAADYLKEPDNCLFCTTDETNIAARIAEIIHNGNLQLTMFESNFRLGKTLAPQYVTSEFIKIYEEILAR